MEALKDMELDLNALKEAAGGDDIITEVGDILHGAFTNMMRRAKNNGQTFEQFILSLFGTRMPEEQKRKLQQYWNSL